MTNTSYPKPVVAVLTPLSSMPSLNAAEKQLINERQTVAAIKAYRDRHQRVLEGSTVSVPIYGLADIKNLVDSYTKKPLGQDAELPPLDALEKTWIKEGRKIEAIKAYRRRWTLGAYDDGTPAPRYGLADVKALCDEYEKQVLATRGEASLSATLPEVLEDAVTTIVSKCGHSRAYARRMLLRYMLETAAKEL